MSLPTSGNKIVDFYMSFVRDMDDEKISTHMAECWLVDPVKTIAIIFNTRDRKNGKKEKLISIKAMKWLRDNKFNTYKKNTQTYVDKYGCWKDMVNIANKYTKDNVFEVEMIANQLRVDKLSLSDTNNSVSLCAKWAPSENDRSDRRYHLAKKVAKCLFQTDDLKKMEMYRKEYIAPLRKHIDILERHMASNDWGNITYENVPSVAMKRNNKLFEKHDSERFKQFLNKVKSGEQKINTCGILPHELVTYYLDDNNEYNEVIELQWKQIINDVKESGLMSNTIPIVDVSGSMFSDKGTVKPIQVSIALGLLISQCTSGSFANKMISFHEAPTIYNVTGTTLKEQVENVGKYLSAGMNTNFVAVFDLLINTGTMFNIPADNMPNRIICLSDMMFDVASTNNAIRENTLHDTIIEKYKNTPYSPPSFVYWNLSSGHGENFPIKSVSSNVAMVSGFSEQLLKVFMNNTVIDPERIVSEILKEYEPFVVIDEDDI